jgi:hypothetical protein
MIIVDINTRPFTKHDIEVVRGDTRKIIMSVVDGETPVDISTWTDIYLTIDPNKSPISASTNAAQLIGEVVETEEDVYVVEFTPDEMLEAGSYYQDIQVTDEDGAIVTLVMGKFKVIQDITKD